MRPPYFTYEYVWVNDGEWRSGSEQSHAIDSARAAALKAGPDVWQKVRDASVIVLHRTPCDVDSHFDICYHATVSFHDEDVIEVR